MDRMYQTLFHRHNLLTAVVLIAALLGILLFGRAFAGDAVVHLAIAENMSNGRFFQYNGVGDVVSASTSPAWTVLLWLFSSLSVEAAPILLKITVTLILIVQLMLLRRFMDHDFYLGDPGHFVGLIIWITLPSVVINSLSGMENVLSALIVLLLFVWLSRAIRSHSSFLGYLLFGLLSGVSILVRPESLIAVLVVTLVSLSKEVVTSTNKRDLYKHVGGFFLAGLVAVLCMLPWYLFQFSFTGDLVTGSSFARLLQGRRFSLEIFPGILYVHSKTLFNLFGAFFPAGLGFLLETGIIFKSFSKRMDWVRLGIISYVWMMILFFTFVVGAEHFGRYTLPITPFFLVLGIGRFLKTFESVVTKLSGRVVGVIVLVIGRFLKMFEGVVAKSSGWIIGVIVIILWFGGGWAADVWRRGLVVGYPISYVVGAPTRRAETTNLFLARTGLISQQKVVAAVTEVQLRYFVDNRVIVLSLDGRSDLTILRYFDAKGCPNFSQYFRVAHPDLVQLGQWDICGAENLIVTWERLLRDYPPGAEIQWEYGVVRKTEDPGYVRLIWPGEH